MFTYHGFYENCKDLMFDYKMMVLVPNVYFFSGDRFKCHNCGKSYKLKGCLRRHLQLECGKPPQFKCSLCHYRSKRRHDILKHLKIIHRNDVSSEYSLMYVLKKMTPFFVDSRASIFRCDTIKIQFKQSKKLNCQVVIENFFIIQS